MGTKVHIDFTEDVYGDVYRDHLGSLLEFGEHTKEYDLIGGIFDRLYENARYGFKHQRLEAN
jgi:hypothetical protein